MLKKADLYHFHVIYPFWQVSVEMVESIISGINEACSQQYDLNKKVFIVIPIKLLFTFMVLQLLKRICAHPSVMFREMQFNVSGDVGAAVAGLRILMREKVLAG